ncbi:MAG: serine/threonine-protein kinase [Anaeromyxobacteraceae bacterium]
MTGSRYGAGDLSRLLEDLAHIPRIPIPDHHLEGLAPGTTVGRFVVHGEIGRGGFGVVYAARDPELGREVALKLLRPGISAVRGEAEWIKAEAEAVARLNHPAIVTIFEAGRSEHGAYLVFELLKGEGLDARMARDAMTGDEVIQIASAITAALDQAHAAGVLHRDLKPVNVFLSEGGGVKVLDFGISQLFDRAATPGSGTPGYMAPEQRDGRTEDARTDLYALGVLLGAMLGGTDVSRKRLPRDDRFGELRRLVEWLTQEVPDQRPRSAGEVAARLSAIARRGRSSRRWGLVAGLVVLLAVTGGWVLLKRFETTARPPDEKLVVILPPTINSTGMPDLDVVSEILRIALAESPRVRVVAAPRVDAVLRELGEDPVRPGFLAMAKVATRLGANLVVDSKATLDADGIVLGFDARDPSDGASEEQFEEKASSIDGVHTALDRAVFRLRSRAAGGGEGGSNAARPVGSLASSSMAAFGHFARGATCMGTTIEASSNDALGRCALHFRRALESDPTFAPAHFQLARILSRVDRERTDAWAHLEAALASPERLSSRDLALIQAFHLQLSGDDGGSLRTYEKILKEDPGDVETAFAAGDLLFHASRYEEATPFLTGLSDLGASFPWALDHLVESYALAGRDPDLKRLLDRFPVPDATQLRPLVRGEIWLGRVDRAIELARRAQATLPGSSGDFLLLDALVAGDRLEEAEALATALQASNPTSGPALFQRVMIASRRGDTARAWELASAPPAELEGMSDLDLALIKASLAAGDRALPRLRAEVRKMSQGAPHNTRIAAVQLALLGTEADLALARSVVDHGTTAAEEIGALEAWKRGDTAGAIAVLGSIDRAKPRPNDALSAAYLLAEVAREDDPSEALAAAARYRRRVPIGPARGWTFGRSLLVSAEASMRLGRVADAREFLDRAERVLVKAKPSYPLVHEMGKLKSALGPSGPSLETGHFGPR